MGKKIWSIKKDRGLEGRKIRGRSGMKERMTQNQMGEVKRKTLKINERKELKRKRGSRGLGIDKKRVKAKKKKKEKQKKL